MHQGVYLLYFEEGRTGLMRELGCSYAEMERRGQLLPVVEACLRYRTPARFDEELVVETRVTEVSGARVRFDYRVLHAADSAVATEGWTTLASCGTDGRPRRLAPELAAALRSALGEPEGASGSASSKDAWETRETRP